MANAIRDAFSIPAVVREDAGALFAWASKQAEEAARRSDALREAVKAQREAEAAVLGRPEYAVADEAKQALAAAKKAALQEDGPVNDAKKALRAARKALKATTEANDLKLAKAVAKAAEGAARSASRALVARLAKREESSVVTGVGEVE